jgi:ATP-dependent DNA helicase RecQ
LLADRFGFAHFRPGQAEIVSAVLDGRDALGVMPTGSGKSLGYVIPALVLAFPVLVVSPLIALMKDQVDNLRKHRVAAEYINSTVPVPEQLRRIEAFKSGAIRLLFVAPERFRSERFIAALGRFRPGLFAIDEAHCITEWGHDFRPDYLRLRDAAAALGRPPILALTATATRAVREQIIANLGLVTPFVIVRGFDRPNLDLEVLRFTARPDKIERTIELARDGQRGIVYCATRKSVDEVARALQAFGLKAAAYHAGLDDKLRHSVSEQFAAGRIPIVVATNAFGMGIDRPDLRFVVHFETPGSIEAYTQEAGRAGRDGAPARCVLLHSAQDARLQRFFIDTAYPEPWVIDRVHATVRDACLKAPAIAESEVAAKIIGARHAREVDSALRILAEAGGIARDFDPDSRDKRARYLGEVVIDHRVLAARATRDRERLADMLDYAERGGCHRARIVDYFSGITDTPPCGGCAGCRAAKRRREPSQDEAEVLNEVLSLVATYNGRYGRKRLIGVLSGSRAKDILEARLDRSPSYGRLKHLSVTFLEALVQECIDLRLLEIEGGKYPVLVLGFRGDEVLRGRVPITLASFEHAPRTRSRRT